MNLSNAIIFVLLTLLGAGHAAPLGNPFRMAAKTSKVSEVATKADKPTSKGLSRWDAIALSLPILGVVANIGFAFSSGTTADHVRKQHHDIEELKSQIAKDRLRAQQQQQPQRVGIPMHDTTTATVPSAQGERVNLANAVTPNAADPTRTWRKRAITNDARVIIQEPRVHSSRSELFLTPSMTPQGSPPPSSSNLASVHAASVANMHSNLNAESQRREQLSSARTTPLQPSRLQYTPQASASIMAETPEAHRAESHNSVSKEIKDVLQHGKQELSALGHGAEKAVAASKEGGLTKLQKVGLVGGLASALLNLEVAVVNDYNAYELNLDKDMAPAAPTKEDVLKRLSQKESS